MKQANNPVEQIVEETKTVKAEPGTYIAADGDSYARISEMFKPAKMTTHEYSEILFALNGGVQIFEGTVIKL